MAITWARRRRSRMRRTNMQDARHDSTVANHDAARANNQDGVHVNIVP